MCTIEKWTKGCILPFFKKGYLRITKNYRGVILTAKVYNALFLNRIWPEIKKLLRKIWMAFVEIDPQYHRFWQSIEGIGAKNLEATLLLVDISMAFDSTLYSGANTTSIWSPQRNCYCYADALQKHEINALLSWQWHWLQHCCWSPARRYIIIYAYNLPRLYI